MIADQRRGGTGGVPSVDPPGGRRGKSGEEETEGEGDGSLRPGKRTGAAVIMHCTVDVIVSR